MTELTPTLQLARFAANIEQQSLPAEVSERAKLLIMDTLGIALRARYEGAATTSLLKTVTKLGLANGNASVIGLEQGYSPPAAAWLNGALAHSLDFDDTHAAGSIHPSAPIVPAALAAAGMAGAHGRDVLAAIIAGYEVQIRLSMALVPRDHYERGYHPTATCGVFGAAAAAARVFGLSEAQTASAFGIALSQAAGSLQFLEDGAWTKLFQVGYAAMNGLLAASLAAEGFKGAAAAIEGKAGFLRAYSPEPQPEKAVAGLGSVFETMNIAVKPYPSCRYSHAAIDAVLALKAANDLAADDVEHMEIGLPKTGVRIIGDPLADKQNPQNVVDGQFSMPFVAAVALREGRMSWDDYAVHIKDPDTLRLCQRINTGIDARAEAEFPANMAGIVRIHSKQGDFEEFVKVPKGEPDNFLSKAELRGKFDSLTGPYLSEANLNRLADALLSLEKVDDIGALFALTRSSAPGGLKVAAGDD